MGQVFVLRCDRRPMHPVHFKALATYAVYELAELVVVRRAIAQGHEVDSEALVKCLLTPAAFAAFFEKAKRNSTAEQKEFYEAAGPPVEVS